MQNIKELLTKYKSGRWPPLDELVDLDLLKIFQRGVIEEKMIPFGILLPARDESDGSLRGWHDGRFIQAIPKWGSHCDILQNWVDNNGRKVFNERCDNCDREHAAIAAEKKAPIIYLCYAGMVDYALPIVVNDQTIAVLFSGQQRPAEGEIWSKDFIVNFATQDSVTGSEDAHTERIKRNRNVMDKMQTLRPGNTPPSLDKLAQDAHEISPNMTPSILKEMQKASNQLGQLAEKTIGYELNVIKAYFTSQVANLLPVPDEDFWSRFSVFLSEFAQFHGFDYAFFYMLRRENDEYMHSLTKINERFPDGKAPLIPSSSFFGTRNLENCKPIPYKPQDAKKALFKSKHLFDSPCYIIPMIVNGPLGLIVMGCMDRKKGPALSVSNFEFLEKQSGEIALILENRRQLQVRDMYATDIAHEVRSPLAAVLATAENLVAGRTEQVEYFSSRILARLRRLQMTIDRFMMFERLLSSPDSFVSMIISIYDVAKECEKEFKDLSHERQMNIQVSKWLADLPQVHADREAFRHVLSNLIHNAIKYGDRDTDIVIEGRMAGAEVKIDVGDVGIPVPPEAIPLLGQRHFRTKEARKRDPSGTGIGLTLVTHFLKIVKGRLEVKSELFSSGQYHVIFSIYMPK